MSNKKKFIPASLVYTRYFKDESIIGVYPTTGLVCGLKKDQDRIRKAGIFENLERDACILMWLLKIPPKRIKNIENPKIKNILNNFTQAGIDIHLFEISLDFNPPVVLALGLNKDIGKNQPKIFVGSSCNSDKDSAILKSLEELTQGFSWIHLIKKYGNYDFGKNFENITHFEHHVLFYALQNKLSNLDFILKSSREIDYCKIVRVGENDLLSGIKKSGYDVLEVDLTTKDIRAAGFLVKKIMIPGLQPLNSNHNLSFLDKKRINEIIKYLNKKNIFFENDLNKEPHPFP